jgi:cyanophycinase
MMALRRSRRGPPWLAAWLASITLGAAGAAPGPWPAETILAGGALAVCSDLSPRACRTPLDGGRQPARHRLDAEGIARASDPRLWSAPGSPEATEIAGWLEGLAALDDGSALDGEALDALLARGAGATPWSRMTDAERAAVRSALELPQLDARGERIRERVDPRLSRDPGGVAVLEAFVDAARARAGGTRPRIAVVTASASDPMDPVDFYEALFAALDADARWWPVDAAMARARFPERDCDALDAHRLSELGIAGRGRVHPDLAARAAAFCRRDDGGLPEVHGVFFAGGDQWRLRRAFVGADDRPNPWLVALRDVHAAGRVVVGGTSAGAAVQSGAAMLSNGSVAAAIEGRIATAPPPEPGCGRAARCPDGLGEDALTLWPAGGLGLARGAIVDTHFSERARELRLLVAMAATDAAFGYGADETSALRVRDWPDRREIDAIGARGGWVFQRRRGDEAVDAWYLAPGARLVIEGGAARLDGIGDDERVRRPKTPIPGDALAPGAVRDAAARLAWRCGRAIRMTAGDRSATLGCIDGATRAWVGGHGVAGVGPLRLSLSSGAGNPR